MHRAARSGNLNVVKILVEEFGVDLAIKSESGLLAYDYAAAAGQTVVTKYLQAKMKERSGNNSRKLSASSTSSSPTLQVLGGNSEEKGRGKIPRSLAATLDALKSIVDDSVSMDFLEEKESERDKQKDRRTTPPSSALTTPHNNKVEGASKLTEAAPTPSPTKKRTRRKKKKRMSNKLSNNELEKLAKKTSDKGTVAPVATQQSTPPPQDKKTGLSRFSSIRRFATFQMRVTSPFPFPS